MQLQLSDKEIKELATNAKVFVEGREYWEQDVVRDRHYDAETETYEARVYSPSGSGNEIILGITADGRLRRASCTCKAYRSYWGFCKHIVATLLDARRIEITPETINTVRIPSDGSEATPAASRPTSDAPEDQSERPASARSRTTYRLKHKDQEPTEEAKILDASAEARRISLLDQKREQVRLRRDSQVLIKQLQAAEARSEARLNQADATDESRIRLEVILTLPGLRSRHAMLKLRIGQERLYVVKNIGSLIESAQSGQEINFGKQYTFMPVRQQLTTDDQRFFDWLTDFYYMHANTSGDASNGNPYFRQNTVLLPIARLTELLEWASTVPDTFTLLEGKRSGSEESPLMIHKAMPPISFRLTPTRQIHSDDSETQAPESDLWRTGSCFLTVVGKPEEDMDAEYIPLKLRRIGRQVRSEHTTQSEQKPTIVTSSEEVAAPERLSIISGDGHIVYFRDAVWIFPDEVAHLSSKLLISLESQRDQSIYIEEEELADLFNLIYRSFNDADMLQTGEGFSDDHEILNADLSIDVWLDREGRDITLAANFVYGDMRVDPHPEAQGAVEGVNADKALIIRDIKKENDFHNTIQGYGFRPAPPVRKKKRGSGVRSLFSLTGLDDQESVVTETENPPEDSAPDNLPQRYYLHGDERILNFISNGLQALQDKWTIYATTRFLNMRPTRVPKMGASLRLSDDQSFLDLAIQGLSDAFSSEDLQDVLAAYREKRRFVRVRSGQFFDLENADVDDLEMLSQLDDWGAEWHEGGLQLNRYRSLSISSWLQNYTESGKSPSIQLSDGFIRLAQDLQNPDAIEFDLPENIGTTLRPYQERGVRWLETLSRYQLGGILADEMGLGKTLQALVYILAHKDNPHPALIISPTSLVYNWEREAQQFTPDLRVQVISGSPTKRQEQLDKIADCDLVITSYTLARQDLDRLTEQEFSSCFLDEAQYIKNPRTQTSRAIKKIKAKNRFALSGTPLENNLTELWSLFDFLMPGYLFRLQTFQEDYAAPILNEQDQIAAENLRFLIAPFILRRLKKDVLKELPDKITTTYHCEMTEEQERVYAAQLSRARTQVEAMGTWEGRRSGEAKLQILSLLTRLRQVACHPSLFLHDYEGGSGKMEMLGELLDQLVHGGHRVLIFSQFTSMLALIREQQSALGRQMFYIDGSISSLSRLEQVERFNTGEGQLFLISLRAGGTGLNLASADTVIHVDPWWNPAVENQATDRAHRIGQTEVVQVMRLITGGTIEEKIQQLQERKQNLLDEVIRPGETFLNQLSVDDLQTLFS